MLDNQTIQTQGLCITLNMDRIKRMHSNLMNDIGEKQQRVTNHNQQTISIPN